MAMFDCRWTRFIYFLETSRQSHLAPIIPKRNYIAEGKLHLKTLLRHHATLGQSMRLCGAKRLYMMGFQAGLRRKFDGYEAATRDSGV
jgi:hypothetical protein